MSTLKTFLTLAVLTTTLISNDDISIEDDFLQSLDEVSEIATKTKLNIDDSPSFITILHSNKLQKLGIETVFEALGQVPGVQLKREPSGVPVVVFRGVSQKGEVKLMIDGVTINNAYRGSIYYYLDFPIDMVERIEVIRGAGSILYGSGAISGVVNIITKASTQDTKNNLFISGGTYDNYKGGAIVSTNISDVDISFDAYYKKSSNLEDKIDRHLDDYSLGIKINNENFGLIARVKTSEIGNAYGLLGVPDKNKNKYQNENNSIFTQLSYTDKIFKETTINALAGFNKYSQKVEAAHPKIPANAINTQYAENSYYAQVDLISNIIENNELLIGIRYESAKTCKSKWDINSHPLEPISSPNASRGITSIYLNDMYNISSSMDISAGLRFDDYSDSGDNYSPTIGMIYRATQDLKLKILYAHAFRAPSWIELTSNKDLEAEVSNSIEAGVIYKKSSDHILRLNFYHTNLDNMITKVKKYIQEETTTFNGAELEYVYSYDKKLDLDLLASYIDARDVHDEVLPDVANILASASMIYDLDNGISFGSLLKYISSSKRSDTDTRDDFKSSLIFDETISYEFKDLTATFIIKDLFDQGTYYAMPQSRGNDFYDTGRSFILKASMEF